MTALARSHATDAIKTLVAAMNSDSAPWATRIAAAGALLDRGWGKPKETAWATVREPTLEEIVLPVSGWGARRERRDGKGSDCTEVDPQTLAKLTWLKPC